jgi:uncharacterized protein YndB with AHSA1/START domain
MPTFEQSGETEAAPEAVWKLLYDPSRFPEWWAGIASVEAGDARGGAGDVTFYPDGYPDFPMPQHVAAERDGHVRISCLVSDLRFDWRLEPREPAGTRIHVHVEIPERERARLAAQQAVVAASLRSLAALALADEQGDAV